MPTGVAIRKRARAGLIAGSAALLTVALPPHDQGFLAWFALVPWLAALDGASPRRAAALSFLGGCLAMAGAFAWIFVVDGFRLWHFATLFSILAAPYAAFGLAVGSGRALRLPFTLTAPPAWVAAEWLRANALDFVSLPWAQLAHSQHGTPETIQIAAFTGAYGVSFLIVLVNAGIADLIGEARGARIERRSVRPARAFVPAGVAGAALAAALLHGQSVLGAAAPTSGGTMRVAVVQASIEHGRWTPENREPALRTYEALTRTLGDVDLVVWPETAITEKLNANPKLVERLRALAQEVRAGLLVGCAAAGKVPPTEPGKKGERFLQNAACAIPADPAEKIALYHKVKLFPFGEYLPHRAWLETLIPKVEDLRPGDAMRPLEIGEGRRAGTLICWEIAFPDLVRDVAAQGVDLLVTIANDGRFGTSGGPAQHAALAAFRAVEHRISVARCANTGISRLYDPHGRLVAEVRDEAGKTLYVVGTATGSLPVGRERTFYTRHGDRVAQASLAATAALPVLAALGHLSKRRRVRGARARAEDIGQLGAPSTEGGREPVLAGAPAEGWDGKREDRRDA